MCGHIVYLPGFHLSAGEGKLHCLASNGARLIDLAQVRAFCCVSDPSDVSVHVGAACVSMLLFFDNDHCSTFGDNKAVTQAVKWSAGLVWRALPFW